MGVFYECVGEDQHFAYSTTLTPAAKLRQRLFDRLGVKLSYLYVREWSASRSAGADIFLFFIPGLPGRRVLVLENAQPTNAENCRKPESRWTEESITGRTCTYVLGMVRVCTRA